MKHPMKKTIVASVCSLAVLGLGVSAAGAQTMMGRVSATDRAFLMKASEANVGEIAGGKAAEQSATTPAVRTLAQRYVDNHTTNEAKLEALAMRLGVTLPMHPTAMDKMEMQKLGSMSGIAYDRAFLRTEESGHMKNIAAFKAELAATSNPMIAAYVKQSIPVLEEHLQLATDDMARINHMTSMNQ
jgi:putative membrane protein